MKLFIKAHSSGETDSSCLDPETDIVELIADLYSLIVFGLRFFS